MTTSSTRSPITVSTAATVAAHRVVGKLAAVVADADGREHVAASGLFAVIPPAGRGRDVGVMQARSTVATMCRNITTLRGLEPGATPEEIEAAARQYVRKVSGVQKTSDATVEPFELAVQRVTAATTDLLRALPPRKVPPKSDPPLRRIAARQPG